jgi:ATP-dependent helicase/nuclease subunit A
MTGKPKPRQRDDHTAAQVAAADPTQSVWVSANAGTGKTHVLIERILRLLLAGTPPQKILTLTFTKAAAAEVASRLTGRLGRWAAMDDDTLNADLLNLLGKPAEPEERQRARHLFALTLEAPEGIRVRTIHSFCESLLGRFPIEAGVAPHFSVVDDCRAAEMRSEAETRVIAGVDGRPDVQAALARLAGLVDADAFASLIAALDRRRGRLSRMVETAGGLAPLIARLRDALGLGPDDTRIIIVATAAKDGAFDEIGLSRAADALDHGSETDQGRAAEIRAWLERKMAGRAETFIEHYAPVFMTGTGTLRANIITKAAQKKDARALDVLRAEQDRVAAVMEKLKSVELAEGTAALLTVGWTMIETYDRLKRARALLDYDDLIEKAGELLRTDAGVSWVHYKLDGGVDHVLVDESQDTSPDQWRVIERLAEDFFAGLGAGDDRRLLPRTVFAVGDEKQSIFSFQGADPAVFGRMRDHFRDRIAGVGGRLREVALAMSYRSSLPVLNVVDAVFEDPASADGLGVAVAAIRHLTRRGGQAGRVELWPTLKPDDTPDPRPWDMPFDKPSPLSPEVRLADKIAGTIRGWLDAKEILESAGRPVEPGDIMILVRTRGRFADQMVKALERRRIPVAGRDRLRLLDHIAVMDLVAAGRFALLPDDDLNTATVLKGPFVGFDEDRLFQIAHGRKATIWEALKTRRGENPPFTAAHDFLSLLLADVDAVRPYEFFSRLLGPKGGRKTLHARLGAEVLEPLDAFLALALDFERDHEPSIEAFLHWLQLSEAEVKREMEQAKTKVRVLTVHGAKGLESEIVFLPDTCTLPGARMDEPILWHAPDNHREGFPLWRMTKEEENGITTTMRKAIRAEAEREYRRLLYVAMTRARERLYICGWQGKNKLPEGCWYALCEPVVREFGKEETLANGEAVVRFEQPQRDLPDRLTAPGEAAAAATSPPAWARVPPPAEPEPAKPLAPSRLDEEPATQSPLGPDQGVRFKRGLIVHRLLQSLPERPAAEREAAARAFLSRPTFGLDPADVKELVRETLAVLSHPDVSELFGPESLAEVPITGVVGTGTTLRVISGQVDRLLVRDDAVIVVDYKSNRPPPESEADVSPAYLRQMAAYRAVLQGIYADRPVRAILLWTAGPSLMVLSDQVLDAHAP